MHRIVATVVAALSCYLIGCASGPGSTQRSAPVAERHEPTKTSEELGSELLKAGRFDEAIVQLTKAIELQPEDISLREKRYQAYLALRDYQSAIGELDYFISRRLADMPMVGFGPDVYTARGNINVTLGNYEAALTDYSRAIEAASRIVAHEDAKAANPQKSGAVGIDFRPWMEDALRRAYAARAETYRRMGKPADANKDTRKLETLQ